MLTNSSHVLGASRPCVGEDGLVVVDERDDLGVGRRNVDLSMDSVAAGKDEVLVQPGLVEWQQQPGFEEILGVDRGEHVRELPACLELLGIGIAIGGRRDDLLDVDAGHLFDRSLDRAVPERGVQRWCLERHERQRDIVGLRVARPGANCKGGADGKRRGGNQSGQSHVILLLDERLNQVD